MWFALKKRKHIWWFFFHWNWSGFPLECQFKTFDFFDFKHSAFFSTCPFLHLYFCSPIYPKQLHFCLHLWNSHCHRAAFPNSCIVAPPACNMTMQKHTACTLDSHWIGCSHWILSGLDAHTGCSPVLTTSSSAGNVIAVHFTVTECQQTEQFCVMHFALYFALCNL